MRGAAAAPEGFLGSRFFLCVFVWLASGSFEEKFELGRSLKRAALLPASPSPGRGAKVGGGPGWFAVVRGRGSPLAPKLGSCGRLLGVEGVGVRAFKSLPEFPPLPL